MTVRGLASFIPIQALSIAAFFLLWQVAAGLGFFADTIIPAPSDIVMAALEASEQGFLWQDLWASALRLIPALLIGSFLGACMGVVSGRVRESSLYRTGSDRAQFFNCDCLFVSVRCGRLCLGRDSE